jgi:hypothetical protein
MTTAPDRSADPGHGRGMILSDTIDNTLWRTVTVDCEICLLLQLALSEVLDT